MREGLLIVPQADNSGAPLAAVKHAAMSALVGAFGGCTVRQAEGAWWSGERLYVEPVWEITAAMSPSPENAAILQRIARDVGRDGRQEAVYVRYATGDVEIISTAQQATATAA